MKPHISYRRGYWRVHLHRHTLSAISSGPTLKRAWAGYEKYITR